MQLAHYKKFFISEATAKIKELEDMFIALERNPRDKGTLAAIVITLHALKGDAATMSYRKLANAMHLAEDFFSAARDKRTALTAGDIDHSFLLVDALRATITSIEAHDAELDLSSALEYMLTVTTHARAARPAAPPRPGTREDSYQPLGSYVATSTESLDQTMSFVHELIAYQQQLARSHRSNDRGASTVSIYRLGTTLSALRAHVLEIKMIPVRQYFIFLSRLVRDISRESHSFVRFVLEDNDVRLERDLLDGLRDACLQLVKNAAAHGFTKGSRGRVTLTFSLVKGMLHVSVADTGTGINWEGLAKVAVARNLLTRAALHTGSRAHRERLLLTSGASIQQNATIASGRGVGMRTVYEGVAKLNGDVTIVSQRTGTAHGTTVSITIPLPPTMYRALVFQWGPFRCALPLFALEGVVQLSDDAIVDRKNVFVHKKKRLPLLRLEELLLEGVARGAEEPHGSVAIVQGNSSQVGLVVPRQVHEEELVTTRIMCLTKNALIAGVAVSEDSVPVTILSAQYIVDHAHAKR